MDENASNTSDRNSDSNTTTFSYFQAMQQSAMHLITSYLRAVHSMVIHPYLPEFNLQESFHIQNIYIKWINELLNKPNPQLFSSFQAMMNDFTAVNIQFLRKLNGQDAINITEPEAKDRRFRNEAWTESAYYFYYQQTYLLFVKHVLAFVKNNPSEDFKLRKQINFFTKFFLNALSPTNFVFTNPEVWKKTCERKGENLVEGFKNFLDDVNRGHGHWSFLMSDMKAFTIGESIATTQGKIIYQNNIIQLIQYSPTQATVSEVPLLIVPPWINKYYILDLSKKNSFVKWVVDQGITVFLISWVNPDKSLEDISFEDYMKKGLLEATTVVCDISKQSKINALGFCIGGTLLATTIAYMKCIQDDRIQSATFMATLLDFSEPGEIEVFIDEEQISALEKEMECEGVLDGRILATTFNLLRANELFWPYYINNYLLGKNPYSFDLLYWNSDSTNLPKKMASDYLRGFYLNNRLSQGEWHIEDHSLRLQDITTPAYFFSTEQDHIAPWESIYYGSQYWGGEVTFVLGLSGHVAGVINHPHSQKYGFRHLHTDSKHFDSPQEWLNETISEQGSWWLHWITWLKPLSGNEISPLIPGEGKFKALQDAPGDYVKKLSR